MPVRGVRVMVAPDEDALRVLVADRGSRAINSILRQHARCVRWAAARLDAVLTPEDWRMLARSLDLSDTYPRPDGYFSADTLVSRVERCQALFNPGTDVFGRNYKSRVRLLCDVLGELGELEVEAILLAVRWFHSAKGAAEGVLPWWLVARRVGEPVPSLVSAGG